MGLETVEVWENERWSVRTWKFHAKMLPKIDPPAWCDSNGRVTSIEKVEAEMQAHLDAKVAGADSGSRAAHAAKHPATLAPCSKAWRWVDDSKWRCSAWYYAMTFQSSNFKPLKDKTSFVRKRCWTRLRESIVHPSGALVTARRIALNAAAEDDDRNTGAVDDNVPINPPSDENDAANAVHTLAKNAPISLPRSKTCVRFAEGTTFSRLLDNRRWRACVASRNAFRWLQQYIADCNACHVTSLHCVAALLASEGLSAFDKQSHARNILAGEMPWPPDSPATAAATTAALGASSVDRETLCIVLDAEILAQLVADTKANGIHAACDAALQTLVMITINAQHRLDATSCGGGHANDGAKPETTGQDIPVQPEILASGGIEGGPTARRVAEGAASTDPGAPLPVAAHLLQDFISETITRLQLEDVPEEGAAGWETADGWFVVDDDSDHARRKARTEAPGSITEPGRSANTDEWAGTDGVPRALGEASVLVQSVYYDCDDSDSDDGTGSGSAAAAPTSWTTPTSGTTPTSASFAGPLPDGVRPPSARAPDSAGSDARLDADIKVLQRIMDRDTSGGRATT